MPGFWLLQGKQITCAPGIFVCDLKSEMMALQNAAKMLPDGTYRSARENAPLHVHPSSVMFTRQPSTGWVIYHEVVETTKSFMRDLTVIDEDWLVELA